MHRRVCVKQETRPHLIIKVTVNSGSFTARAVNGGKNLARQMKEQARTESIQKAAAEQALSSNSRGPRRQLSN